jgi:hypothetical protein
LMPLLGSLPSKNSLTSCCTCYLMIEKKL